VEARRCIEGLFWRASLDDHGKRLIKATTAKLLWGLGRRCCNAENGSALNGAILVGFLHRRGSIVRVGDRIVRSCGVCLGATAADQVGLISFGVGGLAAKADKTEAEGSGQRDDAYDLHTISW
jgi:hypothetical protein